MDECLVDIVYKKGDCTQQLVSIFQCSSNLNEDIADMIEQEIVSSIAEHELLVVDGLKFDALKIFDIHDIQCVVNGKKLELIST